MQDSRRAHWVPPAAGEGGEVREFICGDGGVGAGCDFGEGEGGRTG